MRARPRGAGWRLALVIGSLGCRAGEPDFERFQRGAAGPVVPDRNYFRDAHGRYVTFNGINVGGLLLPGTAAGAALNAIDPTATDPWWQVELPVLLRL